MTSDEQQIREVVKTWLAASKVGDTEAVLGLMTEDVLFLVPGRPPMTKSDFAAASAQHAAPGGPKIDGESEIQEVKVLGDWAFLRSKLRLVIQPPGAAPVIRSGHTLTILQKQNGRWLLARDANLLTTEKGGTP